LQAVEELSQHSIEQISQGRRVAVTVATSCEVVVPARTVTAGSDEGPDEADRGQPVVLRPPVGNADAAAGRLGDWRRAGERLESTSVGESGAVVTDLGSTRAPVTSPRPTNDVMISWSGCRENAAMVASAEPLNAVALSVQGGQQRQRLGSHRILNQIRLAQLGASQRCLELGGERGDAALLSCPAQGGGDLGLGQPSGRGRCRSNTQHGARLRAGQLARASGERVQEAREVLTQQGALVGGAAASPRGCGCPKPRALSLTWCFTPESVTP
jgi:hypothetical protein